MTTRRSFRERMRGSGPSSPSLQTNSDENKTGMTMGMNDIRVNIDNLVLFADSLHTQLTARFDATHHNVMVHSEIKKSLKNAADVAQVIPSIANIKSLDALLTDVDAMLDLAEVKWETAKDDLSNVYKMVMHIVFNDPVRTRVEKIRFILSVLRVLITEDKATEDMIIRPIRILCDGYVPTVNAWQQAYDESIAPKENAETNNTQTDKT